MFLLLLLKSSPLLRYCSVPWSLVTLQETRLGSSLRSNQVSGAMLSKAQEQTAIKPPQKQKAYRFVSSTSPILRPCVVEVVKHFSSHKNSTHPTRCQSHADCKPSTASASMQAAITKTSRCELKTLRFMHPFFDLPK